MKLKNGFKILVVDDNEFFRETLKKCIELEGGKVLCVESVAHARQSIALFDPDAVLSDVQMPKESGIDLLKWMKLEHPGVPVIIMTGFSELLDAAAAQKEGASAFIAKPFKQDDLFEAFLEVTGQAEVLTSPTGTHPEAMGELDYMKISVDDFISGSQIQFPIFMKVPSANGDKFLKVAHQGEDLSMDRVRAYRSKGVKHLYLRHSDYLSYLGINVEVAVVSTKTTIISPQKRARLIRHTTELIQQQFHLGEITEETFDHASTLVEASVAVLSGSDAGFLVLESLQDVSDQLYAHATAVSMISTLIGKGLGWSSTRTLSKVSMAGLLHDIGKRQIPRELALKSKSQMSAEEFLLYETHPDKGMQILSDLGFVPSDVIQAVYQHHERGNKAGFPCHLSDDKIIPIAKVIAVADEFCNLYLNSEERHSLNPKRALEKLLILRTDELSSDCLIALCKAFKHPAPQLSEKIRLGSSK